jgi:hypothetical protein
MKKHLLIAAIAACMAFGSATAEAGSWIFQPSYYSHHPVTPVQLGRRASGGPFYSRPFGAYVNSGFRNLNSNITVGGQTFDHVNVFESWFQTGTQY